MSIGTTFDITETLVKFTCGKCGGVYAISERFRQQKYREGAGWTCPYCKCSWGYFKDNEVEQLKREKEAAEQRARWARDDAARERAEHDQTKASLRATKAAKTRLAKKVTKAEGGVCPHCHRSFENLRRHMHHKHGAGNASQGDGKAGEP